MPLGLKPALKVIAYPAEQSDISNGFLRHSHQPSLYHPIKQLAHESCFCLKFNVGEAKIF